MPDSLFDKAVINLKKIWGYSSFRSKQEDVIRSVLEGKDTLVTFPTGGGKSLCYQLPSTIIDGLTLVISPLISLMQDQIGQLEKLGIKATFVNSTLPYREIEQRIINARNGMYSLLYCSPERLETPLWQNEMNNLDIRLVAVDEAHCISEWGHDFRPSYLKIAHALETLKNDIIWMALTATATPVVRQDIVNYLDLKDPVVISDSFERPNLKWWVIETENKEEKLIQLVKRAKNDSGIVYTGTRYTCNRLTNILRNSGEKVAAYHAGLSTGKREIIQNDWLKGNTQWIVATNAFGMGINKPDCRYVFHYDIPTSLEAYYQEAGRAGRDGNLAFPVLLFNETDYRRLKKNIETAYPDKRILQTVYDALCDSIELSVGAEYEETFQVNIPELIKRSKLQRRLISSGLRLLDKFGIITLVTDYKNSYGIRFTLSHSALLDYISTLKNQDKIDFVDRLLRIYGPESQSLMVYNEEDYLIEKLEKTANQILKGLEVLQKEQILNYEVRNGEPLVFIHEARYPKLPFSKNEVEGYRNTLLQKVDYMFRYCKTKKCRSQYIRTYFGDINVPDYCGNCDVCLDRNEENLYSLNTKNVQVICDLLSVRPLTQHELLREMDLKKEELEHLLKVLIKEGVVNVKTSNPTIFYLAGRS